MVDLLVRYLHYFAFFVLLGAVVIQNMAIKDVISGEDARNLARVDAVAGVSALLAAVLGITLWLWIGKPSSFYSSNPVFHAKLALFGLLVFFAIAPGLFFYRNRDSQEETLVVSKVIVLLIRGELLLILLIPLLAYLMARGIGISAA